MIQGSNFAECHPVGFQFVMDAKLRGAKIIHIDPRFTRTSALADLHVPIRAGSDIALLGGLINHVLTEGKEFREYVVAYTNAAAIINDAYRDTEDLDGLFSGWDPERSCYDVDTWAYESADPASDEPSGSVQQGGHQHKLTAGGDKYGSGGPSVATKPPRDETLQHPRCVFQILKRHYARYTPEFVEEVCGIPQHTFLEVARAITENSGRDRTTNWSYAVGWTQHSVGVQ